MGLRYFACGSNSTVSVPTRLNMLPSISPDGATTIEPPPTGESRPMLTEARTRYAPVLYARNLPIISRMG